MTRTNARSRKNPENRASPCKGLRSYYTFYIYFYSAVVAASVRLRFHTSTALCTYHRIVCSRNPPTPTVTAIAVRAAHAYHNILLSYQIQYDRIYFSEEADMPREHRERDHRRRSTPRCTTDATTAGPQCSSQFRRKDIGGGEGRGAPEPLVFFVRQFANGTNYFDANFKSSLKCRSYQTES